MKNALLKISILFNLGLLAGLICLVVGRKNVPAPPMAVVETKPLGNEAVARVITAVPTEPKPFCWSQLDSPDYHVYVKNLRNIGCPEPTLRAIVTADVHAAYQNRSEILAKQLAKLAGSSWSARLAASNSETALRAELQQLPSLEAGKIADLLGLPIAPPPAAAAVVSANPAPEPESSVAPVALPMVFQGVDLTAMNLDSNQIQVINDVRQSFMNDIGGPDQNPNDPAYLARWQQAQPQADALLRDYLGTTVFQNYQVELGSASAALSSADGNLRQIRDIKK